MSDSAPVAVSSGPSSKVRNQVLPIIGASVTLRKVTTGIEAKTAHPDHSGWPFLLVFVMRPSRSERH